MADASIGLAEHQVHKGRALVSWQTMLVEDLARRQNLRMLQSAYALLVQMRIALGEIEAGADTLSGRSQPTPR
jgi:hypothetical protein